MGLESFKTEGPRSRSKRSSNSPSNNNCIHVANSVDTEEVSIPATIRLHSVEYLRIAEANEDDALNVICACMECNYVATSYEAMVKVDQLDFRESDWFPQFRQVAMNQAPDKPSTQNNEDITGIPDTDKARNTDDEDDEPSGGLMSFKS